VNYCLFARVMATAVEKNGKEWRMNKKMSGGGECATKEYM
jgi:hypothetical protein